MATESPYFRLRKKPKEEFLKQRKLLLSNIPPSTEGELKEFLGPFKAEKIKISESLDSALVTLKNGDQVEEAVEKLNNKEFKDNTVTVKPGLSNPVVCVAHFPLTYTDAQFKELCQKHGTVECAYIMRSEENGDSKGYGIIEFSADAEQAKAIKTEFDWTTIDGQILHVDFVDESALSWEKMQSRCLLINNMPEDFVDVSKLREMFGCVTSPVYCQIIAKGEKSLGYGIVEFRTAEDAEKTWFKLRKEKIEGKEVVMTFCIPGKSAVVINNRIMWKFGDKLQKSSSLLPDPVSAKPVIAGNPIVISLSKLNPKLMEEFTKVLGELQQAYVSQMMSPINKPGLLGPAPSLPLSPMMNPNMQLGLLVMLALYIQQAKKEQFSGVLAKQLNTLSEQDESKDSKATGPKPSILGDPMTGQANVILTSLKQQLNQVPLTGEDGKEISEPDTQEEKLKYIVKKFVANGRYLNLSLLSNLGQLLVTMKHSDVRGGPGGKGQSLLGPVPGSNPQPLMSTPLPTKGNSLLGEPPNMGGPQPLMGSNSGNSNINSSIMQAMGMNIGSGNTTGNMGQSLLSQISQGLVHQIGQNLMYQMSVNQTPPGSGRGLLGDIPSDAPKIKGGGGPGGKTSLLGEPPSHLKSGHGSGANTPLDQGTWKSMETRKRMDMAFDGKGQSDRWGSGAYESGYGNKGGMGGGYNDFGYGGDTYVDMGSGYGGYGDGGGADFYNYQSQYGYGAPDNVYMTESGYNSQFGSGFGSGSGMSGGGGNMSGSGFGMGGLGSNQASGVNFQDGQGFGKGNNAGLGQDNAKFGVEGYSTGMAGGYNFGSRDDVGNGYDSYGSVGGMGYNSSMDGIGNNMDSGMGGGSMSGNGMGGGMGGMGSGGMSGTGGMGGGGGGMGGGGMSGMGSGGGMSGMGGGMGGMGGGGGMGGMGGGGGMSGMGSGGGGMGGMGGGAGSGMGSMGGGGGMSGGGLLGSGSMVGSGGSLLGSGNMGGLSSGNMSGMGSGNMSGMRSGGMGSGSMGGMGSGNMGVGGMSGMGSSGGLGSGGMGGGMSGMGSGGMGGGMSGMGSGGMGGGMSGMGSGGMGGGMSGMGSGGMGGGMSGMGSGGMGGMGSGGMSGIGSGGMGGGSMGSSGMSGMGSSNLNNGILGSMAGESYSTGGIGLPSSGMGMSSSSGRIGGGAGLLGSGSGSFGSSMSSGGGLGSKMSGMGSGSMGGIGSLGGSLTSREAAYFTGGSGGGGSSASALLPSPSKFTPTGQKRSHSQLLPQPEPSPDGSDYIGQHSQGLGGHYIDSYKRTRLF